MTEALRRSLAVVLSAALLVTAPGFDRCLLWAGTQGEAAAALVKELVKDGVLKGPDDPLRAYVVDGGELTALGSILADYHRLKKNRAQADPQFYTESGLFGETDKALREAFDEVRKSSKPGAGLAEKQKAVKDLSERLGKMGLVSGEDAHKLSSQIMAVLTGVRQGSGQGEVLDVYYRGDTARYYDSKGKLYGIVDKQGNIIRSREIEERQKAFNKARNALHSDDKDPVPVLKESGVLDLPTLTSPYYEFRSQISQLDVSFHYDRTYALAEILHKDKNYKPDQFLPANQEKEKKDGKTLEQQFEDEHAGGSRWMAKELLDPLFAERQAYLKKAEQALKAFRAEAEALKGKDSIPESKIKALELKQREVGRLVTLAYLAGEEYHLKHAKVKLTSKEMQESLDKSTKDAEARRLYEAQRERLRARMDAIASQLLKIKANLDAMVLEGEPGEAHIAAALKNLEALSFVLSSAQGQLQGVMGDFNAFATVAGLVGTSKDIADSGWAANLVDWLGITSQERRDRKKEIAAGAAGLETAYNDIISGNYDAARGRLEALVPNAIRDHRNVSLMTGSAEPSKAERMNASLQAFQQKLGTQAKQDFWINLGGNLLLGAAVTAVAGPAVQYAALQIAKGAKTAAAAIEGIQALGALGRGAAAVARGVGHMAEHTAGLLNNLNSKKWVPKGFSGAPVATRFFNAMRMEAAVSLNLGLISGGLAAWQQGRDPNTPYRDKGEAFGEGFKGGAAFMIERPYLLYVGLPTTVFGRGNAVTRVLSNYGESGLVGGTSRTLTQFAKMDIDVVAKATGLFGKGAIGQTGAFMVSMTDQVAKYYAGAEAMGWAAKKTTYYGSKAIEGSLATFGLIKRPDEQMIQHARERIDRAETAGLFAMQWGWLLIPTHSSAGLGPQREQILAEHGFAERQAAGELHTMVGAEGRWMTVKSLPRPSLFSVIFGRHMEGTVGEQARFKVTREQDVAATREVLGKNAKSLPELYKLTQLGDGEIFGALKPRELWKNPGQPEYLWSIKGSEKVRDQAQILFEDMALRRPEAAGELMRTADALMKQEIARIYLQTHGEGGFFRGLFNTSKTLAAAQSGVRGGFWSRFIEGAQALTPGSKSRAAASEIVAQGREVLKAHLETEAAVNAKADAYNKLAREVSKKTTPEFEAAVQDLVLRTDKWLKSGKKGQPPAGFETVLEAWRSEKQADPRLSAPQRAAVNALADYVVTLQSRFKNAEILNAKGTRIQGLRPKQMAVLVEFLSQLAISGPERHFRALGEAAGQLLSARSQKPTPATEAAVGKLVGDLRDWSGSKSQSAKEYAKILDAFAASVDSDAALSAPQKAALKELGRGLKADYTVFTKTPADVVRQYLLLSTGGGKTLLAFEGILPLAKADAGSKRSLWGVGPGKKLIYITTQSNLVAQARIDYKAFKKILTKLEIMTAEEFKTRVAKGRFMGGDRPEDFWILGDELDAMALQPALTIGSETARLANENAAYRGLKNLPRQLETVLGRVEEPILPGTGRKAANWMNLILGRAEDPVVKAASDIQALRTEHRALVRQATLRHTREVARLEAGLKELKAGSESRPQLEAALVRAKAKRAEAALSAKRLETLFDGMALTAQLPAAERPARLGELRAEYRRLLEAAVEPSNPVYEVFREMKAEVARWMESPLRRSETARMEALARIETLGAELGAKLSSKPDAKTLREVRRLVAEHKRLVETAGVKDRGAADAFEPLFKKMIEAAKQGRADEVKALVQAHKELSQRSLTRSSWEAQFEKALDAMTRKYAGRLEKALWGESFWSGLNELYFKESRTDAGEKFRLLAEMSASRRSGKGWVRQELLNLANGFKDDPATVRFDKQDGRVHVIHNGEWFENMDTPTRRWWELHYNTDLTLPYEHQSISTVKDIITNTRVNYVAFSGTLPEQLGPHLKATSIRGVATSPENPVPKDFRGRTGMFVAAKRRVEAALKSPDKQVWIGFSNTKDLKIFRRLLERTGVPKESVAQIFSDAEFLRTLRPDANVARQMNLPGPGSAKVSVFLVDMRVGGRGLDIAFKEYGKAQGWKKGAYKDFEMIILNPQDIAFVHDVQFQGRISPDRVLGSAPGEPMAKRSYSYFIDLDAAKDNPTLRKLAKEQGREITAEFVIENLKQAQAEVQLKQLRSSSVLQDQNSWSTGLKGLLDD